MEMQKCAPPPQPPAATFHRAPLRSPRVSSSSTPQHPEGRLAQEVTVSPPHQQHQMRQQQQHLGQTDRAAGLPLTRTDRERRLEHDLALARRFAAEEEELRSSLRRLRDRREAMRRSARAAAADHLGLVDEAPVVTPPVSVLSLPPAPSLLLKPVVAGGDGGLLALERQQWQRERHRMILLQRHRQAQGRRRMLEQALLSSRRQQQEEQHRQKQVLHLLQQQRQRQQQSTTGSSRLVPRLAPWQPLNCPPSTEPTLGPQNARVPASTTISAGRRVSDAGVVSSLPPAVHDVTSLEMARMTGGHIQWQPQQSLEQRQMEAAELEARYQLEGAEEDAHHAIKGKTPPLNCVVDTAAAAAALSHQRTVQAAPLPLMPTLELPLPQLPPYPVVDPRTGEDSSPSSELASLEETKVTSRPPAEDKKPVGAPSRTSLAAAAPSSSDELRQKNTTGTSTPATAAAAPPSADSVKASTLPPSSRSAVAPGDSGGGKVRSKKSKPRDAPTRPLSAYNFFFIDERDRILKRMEEKAAATAKERTRRTETTDPVGTPSSPLWAENGQEEKVPKGERKSRPLKKRKISDDDACVSSAPSSGGEEDSCEPSSSLADVSSSNNDDSLPSDEDRKHDDSDYDEYDYVPSSYEALMAARLNQRGKRRRPHRKSHGRISFKRLAAIVGRRWKNLPEGRAGHYRDLAVRDTERYKREMEEYHRRREQMWRKGRKGPAANAGPEANAHNVAVITSRSNGEVQEH